MDTSNYIKNMGCNKEWSRDIEMQLAYYIFGINFGIYRDFYINEDNEMEYDNLFHYVMDYINENINNIDIPLMLILHVNNNHYQLLYFNDNIEEDLKLYKIIKDLETEVNNDNTYNSKKIDKHIKSLNENQDKIEKNNKNKRNLTKVIDKPILENNNEIKYIYDKTNSDIKSPNKMAKEESKKNNNNLNKSKINENYVV